MTPKSFSSFHFCCWMETYRKEEILSAWVKSLAKFGILDLEKHPQDDRDFQPWCPGGMNPESTDTFFFFFGTEEKLG